MYIIVGGTSNVYTQITLSINNDSIPLEVKEAWEP